MIDLPLNPLIRQREEGLQLSYQLPHRIYDVKAYPRQAPNGSSILIYGHDTGIRVIWRGGRPFKPSDDPQSPPRPATNNGNGNGTSNSSSNTNDEIMILDSDDEAPSQPAPAPIPTPSFEPHEDEVDPTRPYEPILRHLDIYAGTSVLNLSVPAYVPRPTQRQSPLDASPPMLGRCLVVAGVCADSSVRVFGVPLAPPAKTDKAGELGVSVCTIADGGVLAVPAGVAVTFTARSGDGGVERETRPKSRSRSRSQSRADAGGGYSNDDGSIESEQGWDVLLAVHTSELGGLLSVYRIPVVTSHATNAAAGDDDGITYSFSRESITPIQRQRLGGPARNIAFSPMPYPRKQHSRLLVAFVDRVKVLQCLTPRAQVLPHPMQDRFGFGLEPEFADEGRWLLTLYLEQPQTQQRGGKTGIIDAQWVLGGKGVIALLSDGSWGIWSLERNGSQSAQKLDLSAFAVKGRVAAPPARGAASDGYGYGYGFEGRERKRLRGSFEPLTPASRRFGGDSLFKGNATSTGPVGSGTGTTRGGIAVYANARRDHEGSANASTDECLLLWHGERTTLVPSLLDLWRYGGNYISGSRSAGAGGAPAVAVEGVNLLGQNQNGIALLPPSSLLRAVAGRRGGEGSAVVVPEVVVCSEYQLVVVAGTMLGEEDGDGGEGVDEEEEELRRRDQSRLRRGELDLEGVQRVMERMQREAGGVYS